jgi:hypothetical protein
MKQKLFLSLIACLIFAISCKQKSSGNPNEVMTAFFEAMGKKDWATAKTLATPESQAMFTLMEMAGKEAKAEDMKFDKTKVEFGTAIIDGDNAKVPIKQKDSNEIVNFPMKRINGDWKVAFDKSSMMSIAAEKMKGKTINITDTVRNGLENINLDSMKNELNNAMKEANINGDSMAAEINKAMKDIKPEDIKKAMESMKK